MTPFVTLIIGWSIAALGLLVYLVSLLLSILSSFVTK